LGGVADDEQDVVDQIGIEELPRVRVVREA
jgi:hypothetical protein